MNNNNLIYAYIKKDTNEIVYIGRTNNIERRRKEHEIYEPQEKTRPHYNYPLSKGIRKNGLESYECKIIEDNLTYEESLNREIYWIDFYNTFKDKNKYNYTPGGECITEPVYSEDIIEEVRCLLKDKTPYKQIQDRTNLSLSHISEINTGKRRKNERYTYPINNMTCGRKLTEEQIEEIIYYLKNTNISNQELGIIYGVDGGTIQNINTGKRYKKEEIKYPIRTRCKINKSKRLNEQELEALFKDIMYTNESFSFLANKYGVSVSTIYNINSGKTRKNKEFDYPLRK